MSRASSLTARRAPYARRRGRARLQPGQLDALDTLFLAALDTLDDYRP